MLQPPVRDAHVGHECAVGRSSGRFSVEPDVAVLFDPKAQADEPFGAIAQCVRLARHEYLQLFVQVRPHRIEEKLREEDR